MKKILMVIMSMLIAVSMTACGGTDVVNVIDEGEPILEATGEETVVNVVSNNTENIPGTDYADALLKVKLRTMSPEMTKTDYSYVLSKKIYNYNLKNNNIRVKYTDWGWDDALMQKESLAFISGSGPDIITGESQMPGYAKNGVLRPFPKELADEVRKTLLPASYKAMELDGEIYGVATSYSPVMLIWNKDLIKQTLGADSPYVDTAPKTWTEFNDVCAKIRANGKNKIYAGGAYSGGNYGGYLRTAPFVYMNGGRLVDETNSPVFNDPKSVEAYEFLNGVAQSNMTGALNGPTEDSVYNLFNQDRIAYIIDASWRYVITRDEFKKNVGLAELPTPDDGGTPISMVIGAPYLSVPTYVKNKKNIDAAFTFLKSLISKDVQQVVADIGFRPTAHKEIAEGGDYAKNKPDQFLAYSALKKTPMSLPSFVNSSSQIWGAYGEALVKSTNKGVQKKDIFALWNTAHDKAVKAPK